MKKKKTDQLAFDLESAVKPTVNPERALRRPRELAVDSGEVQTAGHDDEVFSVVQIVRQLRQMVESRFGTVWVRGEVSNLRKQASGHQYFTLKDESSRLSCVLFAGAARLNRDVPVVDGAEVVLCGELGVYEPQGQFQMVVRIVRATGAGALQAKFEALKAKLAAEGLFDPDRKRVLPKSPARIAVVTSPSGAAIRDFLNVLHRRMPSIEVLIFPVRVQGRGAAAEIAEAIDFLSDASGHGLPTIDAVVVTRGGGSIEDLWEFNEEIVARAVAACRIPVVSAVGHEIDFTICDFAADLRAPTPSAAAELLAPNRDELIRQVSGWTNRAARACASVATLQRQRLTSLVRSGAMREPGRLVHDRAQALDNFSARLAESVARAIQARTQRLSRVTDLLQANRPSAAVAALAVRNANARQFLRVRVENQLAELGHRVRRLNGLLGALSADTTLRRGFSISYHADGRPIRAASEMQIGDLVTTQFSVGKATSKVTQIE